MSEKYGPNNNIKKKANPTTYLKALAAVVLLFAIIIGVAIILIPDQNNNDSAPITEGTELSELDNTDSDEKPVNEDKTENGNEKQAKEKVDADKKQDKEKADADKKQSTDNKQKDKKQTKPPKTSKPRAIANCTTDKQLVLPSASECNMTIERDERKCVDMHNIAHENRVLEIKRSNPSVVIPPFFGCRGGAYRTFAIEPINTGKTDLKVNYRGTDTTILTIHLTVKPKSVRPVKTLSITCPESLSQTLYGYSLDIQYAPANANNWDQAKVTIKPEGYATAKLDGKSLVIMETDDYSMHRKPTPKLIVTEKIGNVSASCTIPASN